MEPTKSRSASLTKNRKALPRKALESHRNHQGKHKDAERSEDLVAQHRHASRHAICHHT